jgi:hypothetical protein
MFNLNFFVMKKNSLTPNKGLSLSQAQSISNLCNQRAVEIAAELTNVNNYSKKISVQGDWKTLQSSHPLPSNVVELLKIKAELHACQAFLMENIKAKDAMLRAARQATADLSDVIYPEKPKFTDPTEGSLGQVNEDWGWKQLSAAEHNEFLEAEAHAAHIGQFIHKDGILTHLRNELPHVPEIEWMVIKAGEKSPVTIKKHHTSENLLKIHEELAALHREYEQRVNYFKAKVKNLATKENARIAKHNADLQNAAAKTNNDLQAEYETQMKKANEQANDIRVEFEKQRQARISEVASMRIEIDPRFQKTVDEFLTKLPDSEE